ncbi:DUF916 and DUF3324 domain-containing protein [Enterococcus faecalis]|uniref:DUF916 and DUF3324 domain-containing protein n=1 Tax=Enterococcus faecalis TaxID=1351 RepID=UPI00032FB667|nr:DUF916 and DUF3324 domain-containing protein [Enterococcus faecalis]EOJ68418.1 hypothetical protein WMW_01874 [Enterococcus faecalis EnGen0352]MDI7831926.1 DUF916 and DUF3324 domain-containing protein [Enterococcus faecalis]
MKKIIYCMSLVFILIFSGGKAFAEATGANFSVAPVLPENQIEDVSYFSLSPIFNQAQKIDVTVYNSSTKDVTVTCDVANATTNDNGMPNYQITDKKRDSSLKLGFSDIAHVIEPTITLKSGENKKVTVEINYPNQLNGTMLGGLTFKEITEKNSKNKGVTNRYLYSIAVKINGEISTEKKSIKLNEVIPEQRNYRNYIHANLQNPTSSIIKKLDVKATVTNEKSGTTYKSESTNLKMAPNSNFNYGISLGETALKPGKYKIEITGSADGKAFLFKKNFDITNETAKQLNKNAIITKEKNPIKEKLFYILLAAVIIINIIIGVKIWITRKNRK